MIPWIGAMFWLLLWGWIVISSPRPVASTDSTSGELVDAKIDLHGLNIRQKTDYTDDKFTWMDLSARDGHNLEGSADSHLLNDVKVKVVIDRRVKKEQDEKDLTGLSDDLDVAWFLIKADRGVYSFESHNIELEGNAQVCGYSLDGTLTEWISADRILYDSGNGQVRSIGPAVYEGQGSFGRPRKGIFEAELDLSEAVIDKIEPLPAKFKTPFRDKTMQPPYDPPDALRFLKRRRDSQVLPRKD